MQPKLEKGKNIVINYVWNVTFSAHIGGRMKLYKMQQRQHFHLDLSEQS